ncbi:MAG: oligosaccharide flippase family protein [Hyphomonadaceae bacterium]
MALKKLAMSAGALSAARVFQLVMSIATLPVLARILPPSDYGLMAMAMASVSLAIFLTDSGIGRSLVRIGAERNELWSSAHWLTVAFTAALGLVLCLLAWPVSWLFNEARLPLVLVALAALPLLNGFAEMPAARLVQAERLWPLAMAEALCAVAGAVTAISLALAGFGVWALVSQHLVLAVVRSGVIWAASGFRPIFTLSIEEMSDHLRFARDTLGTALTTFATRIVEPFLVGRFLGAATLGFYSIAYRIAGLPANVVGGPAQAALYPRLVKASGKPERLKPLVLSGAFGQALLIFPGLAALAAAGEATFSVLLSERWATAGALFTLMAPAAAVQCLFSFNGGLLQAVARTRLRLRLTIEFGLLWALAAAALVQFGVNAVALGWSVVSLLYVPRLLHKSLTPLGASSWEFLRALALPLSVSLAIVAAHALFTAFFELTNIQEMLLAMAEALLGYGAAAFLGRAKLMELRAALTASVED